MTIKKSIQVTVNGERLNREVEPRTHLVDFLRESVGLKGSHLGCEHGVCGACTVRLNGQIVRGCLVLAVQADGGSVDTVEGLSRQGVLADLQEAFLKHNALQCGFCTPGMLMAAADVVQHNPRGNRQQVREAISSNYCRCTGYHAIVDAICSVYAKRAQEVA